MPTTLHENRPSAGIGVVEVQKPIVFWRFLRCSRDPLRGSARPRCKHPWFFVISTVPARPSAGIGVVEVQKPMVCCDFCGARATLCGDRRGRGAKTPGLLRFLRCPRNPLRESAWSGCKISRFFAISAALAQPSAGIGVVEVQKLEVFCVFCCPRGLSRGSHACSRAGGSRVRFLPGPRAGVARCNLHFKATCAEQLTRRFTEYKTKKI